MVVEVAVVAAANPAKMVVLIFKKISILDLALLMIILDCRIY